MSTPHLSTKRNAPKPATITCRTSQASTRLAAGLQTNFAHKQLDAGRALSPRAAEVARRFGLTRAAPAAMPPPTSPPPTSPPPSPTAPSSTSTVSAMPRSAAPTPAPTGAAALPELKSATIVLLTGPSGAGKSTLLRAMRLHACRADPSLRVFDLGAMRLPRRRPPRDTVIDCFPHRSVEDTLCLLGRFGLAEAAIYLLPPRSLSAGQQWRFRLALAADRLERARRPHLIIADEFAAVLDRVTACVVAHRLRKLIDGSPHAALLATSHDDIATALKPDHVIRCDFGVWSAA